MACGQQGCLAFHPFSQKQGHRPSCRLHSGFIAVKKQHCLRTITAQPAHLRFSQGRAQRRNRVPEAMRGQQEQVKTALHNHRPAALADHLPMLMQTEKKTAFLEDRTFRRVHIFRLSVIKNAPAEAADRAARVHDRKHDAVAETVIEALAALPAHDQPGLLHCVRRKLLQQP